MSLRLRMLNAILPLTEKRHLARVADPDTLRDSFELRARLFFRDPPGAVYEPGDLEHSGHRVPGLRASAGSTRGDGAIMHFHGGGYVFGSPRTHRAMLAHLSALTGLPAWLPDYRLAPEHPFPAALEDAIAAYRALADRGVPARNIVLGGDSAGGGLALALLAEIGKQGLPLPACCYALSPLTDMTFSGASFHENARADALLPANRAGEAAAMYLQGADPEDPRASPLGADFTGAPPVFLTAGTTEILLDDTRRMARRLARQGVRVTERIEPARPHVWHIFQGWLPEADRGLETLADWIRPLAPGPAGS